MALCVPSPTLSQQVGWGPASGLSIIYIMPWLVCRRLRALKEAAFPTFASTMILFCCHWPSTPLPVQAKLPLPVMRGTPLVGHRWVFRGCDQGLWVYLPASAWRSTPNAAAFACPHHHHATDACPCSATSWCAAGRCMWLSSCQRTATRVRHLAMGRWSR